MIIYYIVFIIYYIKYDSIFLDSNKYKNKIFKILEIGVERNN